MQRYGKNGNAYSLIDNLTYDYTNSGNRLNFVNDGVYGNENVGDFRNQNTGNDDYTYWPDGSLKSDKNKAISLIEYDSFHKKVSKETWNDGRWLAFLYDESGTLIQKTSSLNETWDYVAGLVYKNNEPYQMPTTEGRAVFNNGQWGYEYEYNDHLGNTRLSFSKIANNLSINDISDPNRRNTSQYRCRKYHCQPIQVSRERRICTIWIGWHP